MPLKLGANLPQFTHYDLTRDVTEAALGLERIGYDSIWAFERVLAPVDQSGGHGLYGVPDLPWPYIYEATVDPLVTMALAAAVTDRVELGFGVLVPPLHTPLRLTKALATLDAASGGRVIAGLGSGWSIDEFDAAAPRPYGERGAALDEFLDISAAVWGPDPVTFQNESYRIGPAMVNPKPVREIPLYLAGSTRTTFRRIVQRGAGWIPTGMAPHDLTVAISRLRELAEAEGRSGADVDVVLQMNLNGFDEVPARDRQPYTGSPAQLVEDFAAVAEAGVSHVYVTASFVTSGVKELLDRTAEIYEAVRGAGL